MLAAVAGQVHPCVLRDRLADCGPCRFLASEVVRVIRWGEVARENFLAVLPG